MQNATSSVKTHAEGYQQASPLLQRRTAAADVPHELRGGSSLPITRIGFFLTTVLVFFYVSRLNELIGAAQPMVRTNAFITYMLFPILILSGRWKACVESGIGRARLLSFGFLFVSVLTSRWLGGSAELAVAAVKVATMIACVVAFADTFAKVQVLLRIVALATSFSAVVSCVTGDAVNNRAIMADGNGLLSDPNYFCVFLVTSVPLLWGWARQSLPIVRIGLYGLACFDLAVAARTASRGGMIAFGVGMVVLACKLQRAQKLRFILLTVLLVLIAVVALPETIVSRYMTIGGTQKNEMETPNANEVSAKQSSEARYQLLVESLIITIQHPLLGVGPGMFEDAQAARAAEEDKKGLWHVTHNTYTQVSSEVGIPAAMLLLFALFSAYRKLSTIHLLSKDRQPYGPAANETALYLQISLVMIVAGACFVSLPFVSIIDLLLAAVAAFDSVLRRTERARAFIRNRTFTPKVSLIGFQ